MNQIMRNMINQIKQGQVPEGYKKTDLGIFPVDWETKTIGSLLKIRHGRSQHGVEDENGAYPILATGGVIGRTNSYLCNKSCVLIGRKGTINKPQYMDTPFWAVDTLFYSEIQNQNCAKYLYYMFLQINWKKYDESTGVPSLSARGIESIKVICTLCTKEQKEIAKILMKWDEAIELQELYIDKLKVRKKVLMQKLLTPGDRWEVKEMQAIGALYQPQTISEGKLTSQGYPVYGANGLIGYYSQYNHESSQIAITCRGSTCGEVIYTQPRSWITGNAMVFSVDKQKYSEKYMYYCCKNTNYKNIISGSGQPQITRTALRKLHIAYPTDIKEQNEIAIALTLADDEILLQKQKLEKIKEQRKALMQLLLTGIVRVK